MLYIIFKKLVEMKIAHQTPQNTYYLLPEFKIKSIKVNVLTEYFLIKGRFWPRSVFFATYLIMSLLIGLFLTLINNIGVLSIYFGISILLAIGVVIQEMMYQIRSIDLD